jgi:hypothetical protein
MQVMEGNAGGLAVVREVAEPSALGKKAMDALGVLNDFVTRGQDLGGAASGAMPPG